MGALFQQRPAAGAGDGSRGPCCACCARPLGAQVGIWHQVPACTQAPFFQHMQHFRRAKAVCLQQHANAWRACLRPFPSPSLCSLVDQLTSQNAEEVGVVQCGQQFVMEVEALDAFNNR